MCAPPSECAMETVAGELNDAYELPAAAAAGSSSAPIPIPPPAPLLPFTRFVLVASAERCEWTLGVMVLAAKLAGQFVLMDKSSCTLQLVALPALP